MCGLSGVVVAKSAGAGASYKAEKMMKSLMTFNDVRGKDSAGIVMSMARQDGTLGYVYAKDDIPGSKFVRTNDFANVFKYTNSPAAVIGHNRWATMGTVDRAGAHPHVTKDVALVHNGTLTKFEHLATVPGGINDQDSARVAYEVQESGSTIKLFEEVHGAYALVWMDKRTSSMYMARNDQRSLYWALVEDNYFVYASSSWMIEAMCEELKLGLTSSIYMFPVEEMWSFDMTEFDVKYSHEKNKRVYSLKGLTKEKFKDVAVVANNYMEWFQGSQYNKPVKTTHTTANALADDTKGSNKILTAFNMSVGTVVEVFIDSVYYPSGKGSGIGYGCTAGRDATSVLLVDVHDTIFEDDGYSYDATILGATCIKGNTTIYASLEEINRVKVTPDEFSKLVCGDTKQAEAIRHLFGNSVVMDWCIEDVKKDLVTLDNGLVVTQEMYQDLLSGGCSYCAAPLTDDNLMLTDHHSLPICSECATADTICIGGNQDIKEIGNG